MPTQTDSYSDASTQPKTIPSLARRHPTATFVFLALGLTWLVWIPAGLVAPAVQWPMIVGTFGPAAAGAIMVRLHGNTIRQWLRGILIFRVRARWYILALAIPLFDPVAQAVIAWQADIALSLGTLAERVPLYLTSFVFVLLLGGGQEEFGWRGWMLPQLRNRTNPLVASLLIGVVHAIWHLPLFLPWVQFYGDASFALYVTSVVAMAIIFTWLHNSTGSSVVLAMLLHAQMNTASALAPIVDIDQVGAGFNDAVMVAYAVGLVAIAAGLVARHGIWLATRPHQRSVT